METLAHDAMSTSDTSVSGGRKEFKARSEVLLYSLQRSKEPREFAPKS